MSKIQFGISPTGNGIGVLYFTARSGNFRLRIDVLPKFWKQDPGHIYRLDLDEIESMDTTGEDFISVSCFEGTSIQISSSDSKLIDEIGRCILETSFLVEEEDRESNVKLLVPELVSAHTTTTPCSKGTNDIWELIGKLDENTSGQILDILKVPNFESMSQLDSLHNGASFAQDPIVEKLAAKLLLHKLGLLTKRIKPRFDVSREQSRVFKGKLIPKSLLPWASGQRSYLEFDQSKLDSDSGLLRLLRYAARLAHDCIRKESFWENRASQLDRFLGDAMPISAFTARSLARGIRLRPSERLFAEVLNLARLMVLGKADSFGDSAGQTVKTGLATGVFLSSARLWELLLENHTLESGHRIQAFKAPVPIRANDVDSASAKRPDLAITDARGRLLATIDAKYKALDQIKLNKMPGSDQYQQYAYAASLGLPSLFIYCGENEDSRFDRDRVVISSYVHVSPPVVSVTRLPFPRNGNLEAWWDEIEDLIRPVVSDLLLEKGGEVTAELFENLSHRLANH